MDFQETIQSTKRRYVSFSEVNCFYEQGKDAYWQAYILGIREPANENMIFGSIVHAILENKNYNWREEIKKLTKKPQDTYIRIIEKIIKEVPVSKKGELKLFAHTDLGFSLFAGIDGLNENEILTEYKTGASLWDQQRVDENEQITHYLLAWQYAGNNELPYRLISISSANGKFKEMRTHRTKEQLEDYKNKLIRFKDELIKLSWWTKKCSFNSRIQL